MSSKEVIQKAYQLFSEGNIEAVLSHFDPNIEWKECTGWPHIEGDGISHGPQEVVEDVFAKLPEQFDNFNIEIDDLIESGEKVVMVGHYTGTWKPTGKKFSAYATHVWKVKNEKITNFFQAVDTAEVVM